MMNRYSVLAGSTDGTVTIPGGAVVSAIRCWSSEGGSLVIAPSGAAAPLPTITLPAAADWFELNFNTALQELADGAQLAFVGTSGYYVGLRIESGV
jgi:hypothetical protein